jgi:hypothetical protein
MISQELTTLLRVVAMFAVLCYGIIPSIAQSTKAPQTPAQTTAQTADKSDKAKLTPAPGRMRGTTNEMRRAAAIRNADRKAQAKMKAPAATTQGEVK